MASAKIWGQTGYIMEDSKIENQSYSYPRAKLQTYKLKTKER